MRLVPLVLLLGLGVSCVFTQAARAATEDPVYAPQAPVPVPGFGFKNTANFEELRHNVLELISSSRRRVWLITDYLTDGDVVSALFLAKYRKVDVKVFLGRDKQNQYLSRLSYLKQQAIPVFTRPEHGFVAPTLVFVDQKLYTINRDLNALARIGQAQIAQASPSDVKNFVSWFRDALEYPEAAVLRPEIQAGRSRSGARRPAAQAGDDDTPVSTYSGEADGSYNYDRSSLSRKAPEGVPTSLPKVPVWQKNRDSRQKNPPAPTTPILPVPAADANAQPVAPPLAPTGDATGPIPEERP